MVSLLVVVGDVSGKGLRAAMTVGGDHRGAARLARCAGPAEVLDYLNRVLHGQITGFVTCTAALIAADGSMTLANAGKPSGLLQWARNSMSNPACPLGIAPEVGLSEARVLR